MELLSSLAYTRLKKYLFSTSIFLLKNFLFTWRDRSGVAFLSYEKGFGGEKFRGPRRPFFSSPVVGLHSVGRFISGRFCRVCLGTGDFLRPQGAIPPGLYPLRGGWVYCLAPEVPQKGECRRGRRYFWPCRTRVGFGPATGPTLKTALCHIRALVGRNDKYRGLRGRSQEPRGRILRYRGCIHLTATSSGRFTPHFFLQISLL